MRVRVSLLIALVIVIAGALVWPVWATSQPEITEIVTCKERPTQFEPRGGTSLFTTDDEFAYCLAQVSIPASAARSSYSADLRWYSPDGKLYYEQKFTDLERGYTWALWGSIRIEGARAATLPGFWRVELVVKYGPSKFQTFTITGVGGARGGAFNRLGQQPTLTPTVGREQEPNETAQTANMLIVDKAVQGEVRFYSHTVYDQDWFRVRLDSNRKYWLVVTAVGMITDWLSPISFLSLYRGDDLNHSQVFSYYSQQKRGKEHSTCDTVIVIHGPGVYYISISSQSCEYDIAYSLKVTTTEPTWATGHI